MNGIKNGYMVYNYKNLNTNDNKLNSYINTCSKIYYFMGNDLKTTLIDDHKIYEKISYVNSDSYIKICRIDTYEFPIVTECIEPPEDIINKPRLIEVFCSVKRE